jgi:hypothetical protein
MIRRSSRLLFSLATLGVVGACSGKHDPGTPSPAPAQGAAPPLLVVEPSSSAATDESGHEVTFAVRLSEPPRGVVVVHAESSDPAEGIVRDGVFRFDASSWSRPQTVTVAGVDDGIVDGTKPFTVRVAVAAATSDPAYAALDAVQVPFVNLDNDVAALALAAENAPITAENGPFAVRASVRLLQAPTGNVRVRLASSDTKEGVVEPSFLEFSAADWSQPKAFEVRGVDDDRVDGTRAFTVQGAVESSEDPAYRGLVATLALQNQDDDHAALVVEHDHELNTRESGTQDTFRVRLTAAPAAPVRVPIASLLPKEIVVQPAELVFTAETWRVPQTVTVTGQNDAVADGNQAVRVGLGPSASDDAVFAKLEASVRALNLDDDAAGIVVLADRLTTKEETQSFTRFTVALQSRPTAPVTINLTSTNPKEGVPSEDRITFYPDDPTLSKDLGVRGLADGVLDGDVSYAIRFSPAASDDKVYDGLKAADVAVLSEDAQLHFRASSYECVDANGGLAAYAADGSTILCRYTQRSFDGTQQDDLRADSGSGRSRLSGDRDGVYQAGHYSFASFNRDARLALVTSDAPAWGLPAKAFESLFVRTTEPYTRLGAPRLLTVGLEGAPLDDRIVTPALAGDGSVAVFSTWASNLVAGDTNGTSDVFVTEVATAKTRLVSVGLAGAPANGSSWGPTVSDDGQLVAFVSSASNLVENGASNDAAYVANLATGAVKRIVPRGPDGRELSCTVSAATISGDASHVGLACSAAAYVVDLASGETSLASAGLGDLSEVYDVALSRDGLSAAFPGSRTFGDRAVYVYDARVKQALPVPLTRERYDGRFGHPLALSADGRGLVVPVVYDDGQRRTPWVRRFYRN